MTKHLCRICSMMVLLFSLGLKAQQTSVQIWSNQLQTCGLRLDKLYAACAHFPRLENSKEDKEFEKAIKEWQRQYPLEEKTFWNLDEIKKGNPSAYYLGLNDGKEKRVFGNSIWEWVQSSKISETRLNSLAAHFPKPKLTGNAEADEKKYNDELEFWINLYPLEYEHLFNASELTALNPYYSGYYKPVQVPSFISAPLKESKPQRESYSKSIRGEMAYQLSLRAWYFVFEPDAFTKNYGADYQFPQWFNKEKFRKDVIKKFEDTKNPPANANEIHPGK
ncbi:MAG: hypothetical protein U0T74_09195 [Chitinophagales bacterium]